MRLLLVEARAACPAHPALSPAQCAVLRGLCCRLALLAHLTRRAAQDAVERMIAGMKQLVRQRLAAPWPRQLLPRRLGGLESGADMVMRLLLMREFNFDPCARAPEPVTSWPTRAPRCCAAAARAGALGSGG
jgi:hypothetical protein